MPQVLYLLYFTVDFKQVFGHWKLLFIKSRSSHPTMFCKITNLKYFEKFPGKKDVKKACLDPMLSSLPHRNKSIGLEEPI